MHSTYKFRYQQKIIVSLRLENDSYFTLCCPLAECFCPVNAVKLVRLNLTFLQGMTLASIEHYLRWADAIMMIYSVTDADGFSQLKTTATTIIEKISDLKEKEQK